MNIPKIKVHYLTYFFILMACLTGMFKNFIVLAFIIIIHELGHIIIIKYFKYEIIEVLFLPFGGQTKITKDLNSPLKEEFLISISGVLFQLFISFFIYAFFDAGYINMYDYLIFKNYSLAIIVFNLLPIIPLDGSYIFKSILEYIISYKKAYFINIIISLIFLLLFLSYNYLYGLNNYLICSFLLYKIIIEIKNFKFQYNRFLLERYLKKFRMRKIKILNYNEIHKMQKERKHYFLFQNKFLNEKDRLHKLFDNKI